MTIFIWTPDDPSPSTIKEKGTRKGKLSIGAVSAMMIVPDWRAPFMPKRSPISSLSLAMASAGSESEPSTRACWASNHDYWPGRQGGRPVYRLVLTLSRCSTKWKFGRRFFLDSAESSISAGCGTPKSFRPCKRSPPGAPTES